LKKATIPEKDLKNFEKGRQPQNRGSPLESKEDTMKNAMRAITTLSLFVLIAISAQAQAVSNQMKANIPFKFTVGQTQMPAGDYTISFVNSASDTMTILIKSADGRAARMVHMLPVEAREIQESGKLVFNHYGQQYFLSQIWSPAELMGLELAPSRTERALERELAQTERERVTVALARR
jgi:hypothetical protein